ncbi:MAG: exodeoxyribonuclease III [Verrucomicrobiota bacterium JB022]|nr:exodeoxyribonuclease III [Verrucomicrobiota bacterium JB022]
MKIISWNVNGLRSVLGKGLADFIHQEQPDILCLQEIKARADNIADLAWCEGYTLHWNPAQKPGYSGTLTLSRQPVEGVQMGVGEPEGDAEGRVVTTDHGRFYLVNVYTPNSKNELLRLDYRTQVWDPAFRRHLQKLAEEKPVLFCGDLNVAHQEIDLARPQANRRNAGFTDEERAEFTQHLDAGFVDSFRLLHPDRRDAYSWWSFRAGARKRNIGWRIDYVCISNGTRDWVQEAFIRDQTLGSDHAPVGVVLGA